MSKDKVANILTQFIVCISHYDRKLRQWEWHKKWERERKGQSAFDGIHCAPSCFTAALDTEWNMCGLFTSTKTSSSNSRWMEGRKSSIDCSIHIWMNVQSVLKYTGLNIIAIDFPLFYVKSSNKWIRCFSFESMYDSMLSGTWHRMFRHSCFFFLWEEKYMSIYVFNRWSNDANISHCNSIKDIHNKCAFSTIRIELLKASINLTACFSFFIWVYGRVFFFYNNRKKHIPAIFLSRILRHNASAFRIGQFSIFVENDRKNRYSFNVTDIRRAIILYSFFDFILIFVLFLFVCVCSFSFFFLFDVQ